MLRPFDLLILITAFAPKGYVCAQAVATSPDTKADYSQEAFVIERDSNELTYENDGTGTRKSGARVRIQSDAGVQRYAVLTFPYQSAVGNVEIDYVRVYKPDAAVVVTPLDSIQDLPSEISRQAPLYSDLREKHVAVKGLGVGDVLEYQAHWNVTKPLVPGQFWFSYSFAQGDIILQQTLKISIPKDRPVKWSSSKAKPVTSETAARRIFAWTGSQLEHKTKEREQKERETLVTQAARGRLPQPEIQFSSFQTWEDIGRWYDSIQKDRVQAGPAVRAKAAELTKDLANDRAKATALYRYVSHQVHYIGIDFGIGRYQPHSADEVLANSYGDCKDKHTLLAALLAAVGIQSSPGLIGAVHDLDPDLPSPSQFDHVISAVWLDGQLTWLDTTPEVGPFAYLTNQLRGKKALLVYPDKAPALITTPLNPPIKSVETFRIDAKLADTGILQGKIERSVRGNDSELLLRALFRGVPLTQWKELMQQISYGSGFAGDVTDVTASSPENSDEPFRLAYSYLRKDYPDWSNRRVSSPIPPMLLPSLPDEGTKPVDPIWLGSPMELKFESHVELPKSYRPTLFRTLNLDESFAEYHRSYSFKGGVLTTERHLVVKRNEVPVDLLEAYRKFRKAVDDDGNMTTPVSSASSSRLQYESEIWELPYSEDPKAARAYDDAREKYSRHDLPGEIDCLKRAVSIDPKFTRAWLWLGEIYMSRKRFDDAVEAYRKAIEVDPETTVSYKALGSTLQMMGKWDEAVSVWQQMIKAAPGESAGLAALGMSFVALKRYAEAESALDSAAQLNPEDADIQFQLGTAFLRGGDPTKAVSAFNKALHLAPDADTLNSISYEMAEAGVALQTALEYSRRAVAKQCATSQQINLAELRTEDLESARGLGNDWDTQGWIYLKTGDLDRAEKYLRPSWVLSQNPYTAGHLGQLYERQDKKAEAVHMYKLALNLASSFRIPETDLESIRKRLERLSPGTESGKFRDEMMLTGEASSMRTTHVSLSLPDQVSAEFFLVFARNPKTSSIEVDDVKFISGSESLKAASQILKATNFKVLFPPDNSPRLLRRGILACSPHSGCSLTFFNPQDVRSVR